MKRHHVYSSLITSIADALPAKAQPMAYQAAIAAVRSLRPNDAVKAARAVIQRVPKTAKVAIEEAIAVRETIREERIQARTTADPYSVPLAKRLPGLREKKERAHVAWIWAFIDANSV